MKLKAQIVHDIYGRGAKLRDIHLKFIMLIEIAVKNCYSRILQKVLSVSIV